MPGTNNNKPRGGKKKRATGGAPIRRGVVFGRLASGQAGETSTAEENPQPETAEIVKALIGSAREQGRVSHEEINDALPDNCPPEHRDAVYTRLQELGIEIGDSTESADKSDENEIEEGRQLEALDDPVRQYMHQMSRVPLLTREQEVEIFKRIEEAEFEIKALIYSLGFAAKEHIAIAEKLLYEPHKERIDRRE